MFSITHDLSHACFFTIVDGLRCTLDYQRDGQVMRILHTGVPAEVGGRGIAAALTEYAFATARQQGWRVQAICTYTISYLRRHPEHQDLIDPRA